MVTNLFSNLEPKPDDPILGISSAYRADPRPEKVNLSVGMYLDDSGEVPLLKSVAEAEKRLSAPPKKISFDRKKFAPYLDKLGGDQEIEALFLEFLQERVR